VQRALEQATIVVTGASSGIGKAAALRFARRGSKLGLCAREPAALAAAAAECEAAGAAGVVHRALDVGKEEAVEGFAATVEERFGRIDIWVNGAGVIAYGSFLEIPSEVFARVVQTDLLGQVHGARAALRRFVAQEQGVLINLSSVWGRVTSPDVSPYVVSKTAVRAFSECLRGELRHLPDVHVTTIAPQAVDTPIFDNAADFSGRKVRAIPPVLSPQEVAEGIEACAESPRRQVSYGRAGRLLEILDAAAPPLYRRFAHPAFVGGTFGGRNRPGPGNVLEPVGVHAIEGGWRRLRRGTLRRAFLAASVAALLGRARLRENDRNRAMSAPAAPDLRG
jgi:short-subunit dehydrogenase